MNTFLKTVPIALVPTLLALPFGVITQATYATEETSVQGEQAHASESSNLLSYIPKWVDATRSIFGF